VKEAIHAQVKANKQNKTKQDKQNKTKQDKTKQNKTTNKTEQNNTKQNKRTQNKRTQKNTTQHNTKQNKTKQLVGWLLMLRFFVIIFWQPHNVRVRHSTHAARVCKLHRFLVECGVSGSSVRAGLGRLCTPRTNRA